MCKRTSGTHFENDLEILSQQYISRRIQLQYFLKGLNIITTHVVNIRFVSSYETFGQNLLSKHPTRQTGSAIFYRFLMHLEAFVVQMRMHLRPILFSDSAVYCLLSGV